MELFLHNKIPRNKHIWWNLYSVTVFLHNLDGLLMCDGKKQMHTNFEIRLLLAPFSRVQLRNRRTLRKICQHTT